MILKSTLSGKTFDYPEYASPHKDLTPHELAYDAMWTLPLAGRWEEFKKTMCACRSRGGRNCQCSNRNNVVAI